MIENENSKDISSLVGGIVRNEIHSFEKRLQKNLDERFTKVRQTLDVHTKVLDNNTKILDNHTKVLDNHTQVLEDYAKQFAKIHEKLDTHTRQLETIVNVVAGPMVRAINNIEQHLKIEKTDFKDYIATKTRIKSLT